MGRRARRNLGPTDEVARPRRRRLRTGAAKVSSAQHRERRQRHDARLATWLAAQLLTASHRGAALPRVLASALARAAAGGGGGVAQVTVQGREDGGGDGAAEAAEMDTAGNCDPGKWNVGAQLPPSGAPSRTLARRLRRAARLARLRKQLAEARARTEVPGATPNTPAHAAGTDEAPLFVRLRPVMKGSLVPAGPLRPATSFLVSKFGSLAGATSRTATLGPVPQVPPARSPPAPRANDPVLRNAARAAAKPWSSGHDPCRPAVAPRAPSHALVAKSALARHTAHAPLPTAPLPGPPPTPSAEEPGPPPDPGLGTEPYPRNQSCPCSLCWWARRAATLSTANNGTAHPAPHSDDPARCTRGRTGGETSPAHTGPRP